MLRVKRLMQAIIDDIVKHPTHLPYSSKSAVAVFMYEDASYMLFINAKRLREPDEETPPNALLQTYRPELSCKIPLITPPEPNNFDVKISGDSHPS